MSENVLPRLLLGVGERPTATLDAHHELHGPMPEPDRKRREEMIESVAAAGLRGRGGAAFPTAIKMRTVASRRGRKVVLANAAEGEPASKKDRVLLREVPHLVLDGIGFAAAAVGAREAMIAVKEGDVRAAQSLRQAMTERAQARLPGPSLSLVEVPPGYVSGQETALVNLINTGHAQPTFGTRPFERGVRQLPTLVQNTETFAHLALIARHGSRWFRSAGTGADPGTALITLSGAVAAPGVYEIETGTPLADLLEVGQAEPGVRAALLGGYFGTWIDGSEVSRVLLDGEGLARFRASLGAGVIVVLGRGSCPVAETVRVAEYLAAEGAGQCGPCVNGLAAIADTLQRLGTATAPSSAYRDLERWCAELPGRGACAHPDGAVRFVSSAGRVFAAEFDDHARRGRCELCASPPVLPAPQWRPASLAA